MGGGGPSGSWFLLVLGLWPHGPLAVMAAGCCNNESAFLLRQG